MKKNFSLFIFCLACLLAGLVNGCKKDSLDTPSTSTVISTSFIEEFDSVFKLAAKGWVIKDNSPSSGTSGPYALWVQGFQGYDKAGVWSGFSAYSYRAAPDEFVYSSVSPSSGNYSISSWLITPVLSVKNGDNISFYSRGDSAGSYTGRMQVLMNKSSSENVGNNANTAGAFTTLLLDINSVQAANGYPTAWTRYEYTFSGISGKIDTRIGFRHYVTNTSNAKGIGIDLFRFQVN